MNNNDLKDKKNHGNVTALAEAEELNGGDITLQAHHEILRKRVLDLLIDPDPVRGIYAMYGAHERHPQCFQKK